VQKNLSTKIKAERSVENFNEVLDYLVKLAISENELAYIQEHKQRWIETLKLIRTIEQTRESLKILDIGCGGGWMAFLVKKILNCDVCAIDIEREETPLWSKRLNDLGIRFNVCDITREKIPYSDESFDIVLFLEVLEHLITSHSPYQIFFEIKRVLFPNSYLILSTPNVAALHKRFLLLIGKNPVFHGFKNNYSYKKHFREYTVDELEYVLDKCGFSVERVILRNFGMLSSNILLKLLTVYPRFKGTVIIVAKKR
jgi:2-polyprenyl-3-methyl-5-hydroxy-6-metoxy-1,4-benzoquinol methylase